MSAARRPRFRVVAYYSRQVRLHQPEALGPCPLFPFSCFLSYFISHAAARFNTRRQRRFTGWVPFRFSKSPHFSPCGGSNPFSPSSRGVSCLQHPGKFLRVKDFFFFFLQNRGKLSDYRLRSGGLRNEVSVPDSSPLGSLLAGPAAGRGVGKCRAARFSGVSGAPLHPHRPGCDGGDSERGARVRASISPKRRCLFSAPQRHLLLKGLTRHSSENEEVQTGGRSAV